MVYSGLFWYSGNCNYCDDLNFSYKLYNNDTVDQKICKLIVFVIVFNFRMWVVAFAVILLDYASQAAINPCESLVADILESATNANTG